jgi:hypothetical protein
MRESTIVDAIKREFDRRKAWTLKVHGSPLQAIGVPDIVGCADGRFFGLEVKVPGSDATKIQSWCLIQIMKAGGIAKVVHSVDEAVTAVWG